MSGDVVYLYDLATLKRKGGGHEHGHDQRGIVVRMPGNRRGVRRANGTVSAAGALRVLDRSTFCPGDTVAWGSDVGGQIGVVTGVSRALDLIRFDDDGGRQQGDVVSTSRPSEELRRVTGLVLGDYVVSGPWLGMVAEVSLHVDVAFDDGALCRVTGAERKLVGEGDPLMKEDSYTYDLRNRRQMNSVVLYPGQRVVGHSPSVFQESRWIKGYWKPSRIRGTVSRVGVAGVLVHWVASMHLGTNKELIQASAPPAWQPNPEKLALLPYPASVWYVGDLCFLRTPPSCHGHQHDVSRPAGGVVVDGESPSAHRAHGRLARSKHGNKRRHPDVQMRQWEQPMSVAGTRTTVDVLWQDGTRQCGVPSPSLVFFNRTSNDYDFFPGQHVISRPAGEQAAAAARSGIVRSFNCRDKTLCVSWFPAREGAAIVEEAGRGSCGETVVSVYDVARDSGADFFYGDLVVRLRHPTEITANGDLSCVGHVVDLCDDRHIQIKWGDGNTSKVLPREIAIVRPEWITETLRDLGDWLGDNGDPDGQEGGMSAAAQEPVAAAITHNNGDEGNQDTSDGESDSEDSLAVTTRTTMDRVRSATWTLIRLAGDVFSLGMWNRRKTVVKESVGSEPPAAAMEDVVEAATLMSGGDASTSTTCEMKTSHDFAHFNVVQCPPDHHFIDSMEQGGTPVGRKWTKRVQKEWKILDNGLPDTIYVRAFENRMDLLRVVMVGASGTPYHDGLFFFDMHLPPSYPAEPPFVNYRSFGLWVNPNLYPSGTVCLSLLNTFGGEGVELWSPEASSILQVVVSIQGLVLTAQPYYNEAAARAHAGTTEGLRNELPYSENSYLLNLQTMLHLLRRPPAGFEEFVRDHFRRRGQHVIRACEAYQDGCLVGTLDEEGHPMKDSKRRPCSAGFKLALVNIVPRLVEALANNISGQGCKTS